MDRSQAVIEAAKKVRDSLKEYESDKTATGEIFYAEMMVESVDLLVEAVNDYEAQGAHHESQL